MNISHHNLIMRYIIHQNSLTCIPASLAMSYMMHDIYESHFLFRYNSFGYKVHAKGSTNTAFVTTGIAFKALRSMHMREDSHAYYKK